MMSNQDYMPVECLLVPKALFKDAITAAFREFSQKEIQKANRPSIHKRLAAYRGIVAGKTKGKARNKHQEVSR